jgi:hypothetical protein
LLVPIVVEFNCHCGHRWKASDSDRSPKGLRKREFSDYRTTCPRCGRRLKIDSWDTSAALRRKPRRR